MSKDRRQRFLFVFSRFVVRELNYLHRTVWVDGMIHLT